MPGSSRKMFLFGPRFSPTSDWCLRLPVVPCGNFAHESVYFFLRDVQILEDIQHGSCDSSLNTGSAPAPSRFLVWCVVQYSPLLIYSWMFAAWCMCQLDFRAPGNTSGQQVWSKATEARCWLTLSPEDINLLDEFAFYASDTGNLFYIFFVCFVFTWSRYFTTEIYWIHTHTHI